VRQVRLHQGLHCSSNFSSAALLAASKLLRMRAREFLKQILRTALQLIAVQAQDFIELRLKPVTACCCTVSIRAACCSKRSDTPLARTRISSQFAARSLPLLRARWCSACALFL